MKMSQIEYLIAKRKVKNELPGLIEEFCELGGIIYVYPTSHRKVG